MPDQLMDGVRKARWSLSSYVGGNLNTNARVGVCVFSIKQLNQHIPHVPILTEMVESLFLAPRALLSVDPMVEC